MVCVQCFLMQNRSTNLSKTGVERSKKLTTKTMQKYLFEF